MPEVNQPVLLVRLRPGVVGETQRACHLVPTPPNDVMPTSLVAYCGLVIQPGTADLLSAPDGMPCVSCLLRIPLAPVKEIQ
ncbi:hypothetical protein SK803_22385 [Lentzea sp. BCCO 10_0856]|uniref:Uncharacterized protein n=1 Tax=Lentzea miocenica TaxID=3095431 RepID=A0ABU4T490_9PSEU|nr:hypothetical protein [Lentzea sp. BCCO 10_0856]MDX8032976.1 hypothetical protein [Lentzea sp. BCCO 10_0856]